ncbi:hypothetical protein K439DRAFT_1618756 [Ramaria rubella]|nr:hypothetical protein K439DRAFT_1618756 [Ramaria rubella]
MQGGRDSDRSGIYASRGGVAHTWVPRVWRAGAACGVLVRRCAVFVGVRYAARARWCCVRPVSAPTSVSVLVCARRYPYPRSTYDATKHARKGTAALIPNPPFLIPTPPHTSHLVSHLTPLYITHTHIHIHTPLTPRRVEVTSLAGAGWGGGLGGIEVECGFGTWDRSNADLELGIDLNPDLELGIDLNPDMRSNTVTKNRNRVTGWLPGMGVESIIQVQYRIFRISLWLRLVALHCICIARRGGGGRVGGVRWGRKEEGVLGWGFAIGGVPMLVCGWGEVEGSRIQAQIRVQAQHQHQHLKTELKSKTNSSPGPTQPHPQAQPQPQIPNKPRNKTNLDKPRRSAFVQYEVLDVGTSETSGASGVWGVWDAMGFVSCLGLDSDSGSDFYSGLCSRSGTWSHRNFLAIFRIGTHTHTSRDATGIVDPYVHTSFDLRLLVLVLVGLPGAVLVLVLVLPAAALVLPGSCTSCCYAVLVPILVLALTSYTTPGWHASLNSNIQQPNQHFKINLRTYDENQPNPTQPDRDKMP